MFRSKKKKKNGEVGHIRCASQVAVHIPKGYATKKLKVLWVIFLPHIGGNSPVEIAGNGVRNRSYQIPSTETFEDEWAFT